MNFKVKPSLKSPTFNFAPISTTFNLGLEQVDLSVDFVHAAVRVPYN